MGLLSTACRIVGVGTMLLAFGCTLVAVATVWTAGHIETSGSTEDTPISGAAASRRQLQQASLSDEYVFLTLWRREIDREPGTDESDSWRSYTNDQGHDSEYCPERNGQTFRDAFVRIQAAQACTIIAVIFSLFTLIGSIVSMLGRLVSRAVFGIPAFIMLLAGCGSLIAWMEFYNMCDNNFCHRYVNQPASTAGECGLGVGLGFMCAAVGLTFLGMIPLCAAGPRMKHY